MRQTRLVLYGLMFLTEIVWMAIVPLAPVYAREFSLSGFESGTVLATGGVTTLLVALPAGMLADRLGARRVTTAAAFVVLLGTIGQGLATDYWTLLASRGAFGLAMGTIWSAGVAWLASLDDGGGSSLGGTMVVAGAGIMVGPLYAGTMTDHFGLVTPFIILGAGCALVCALLVRAKGGTRAAALAGGTLRDLARGLREPFLIGGLAAWTLIGFVNGGLNLLIPLGLERQGLSAGEIGAAFTVSSTIFVIVSIVLTRMGARSVRLEIAGIAAVAYAALIVFGVASTAMIALLVLVVARAPAWAALATLAYPFGAAGASAAGIGQGSVMGALNLVWGLSNALGPLVAGGVADAAGLQLGFVPALVVAGLAGGLLLRAGRAGPRGALAPGRQPAG